MKSTIAWVGLLAVSLLSLNCKEKPEPTSAPAGAAAGRGAATGNHDAAGPITEAALGVKIYPGARLVTSGETDELVSANIETPDAAEKVVKFYQKELGLSDDGTPTMMLSAKKNNRTYVVSVTASGGLTSASIMGKK